MQELLRFLVFLVGHVGRSAADHLQRASGRLDRLPYFLGICYGCGCGSIPYGGAGAGDEHYLMRFFLPAQRMTLPRGKLAEEGAKKTGEMRARAGRSSHIPFEKTVGHPDPGAVAISIAISAMVSAA